MDKPDYNSAKDLKMFLEKNSLAMQKKFGQNFLVNESARKKIIDSLELKENMSVWEIGPGLGNMTCEILERGANLTVFEIDNGFIYFLNDFFKNYIEEGKLKIIKGDVLKNWKKEAEKSLPERLFGNLPYNIAATFIGDTISENVRFEKAVFTVQKEVCERAFAKCGSENYSSFSVLCQWAYDLKNIMELPGSFFWPKPNVSSKAFSMTKKKDFPQCENPKLFAKMERALFSSRRKTIKNNLSLYLYDSKKAEEALEKADIPPQIRAEALSLDKMLRLSDVLNADILKT